MLPSKYCRGPLEGNGARVESHFARAISFAYLVILKSASVGGEEGLRVYVLHLWRMGPGMKSRNC